MASTIVSQVRQNYHVETEEDVNKQINMELYAMYTYLSMVRLTHIRYSVLWCTLE